MKYRSRVEILAQILEIANGNSVKISNIIQYSNIPHELSKQYLSQLIATGLLEYQEEQRTYKTGYRGIYFMSKYNQMKELMTIPLTSVAKTRKAESIDRGNRADTRNTLILTDSYIPVPILVYNIRHHSQHALLNMDR
jgi:predicted transcriptional regulator